ncbi:class I SAM-dependent methyltransferase [Parasegetibacter sp. NRK P23]|uniref:class I SAM-dependent methyltransferase n=1 Tax=Parasegetibacter sp. NRK P23 TaxID=2942999 RepID=UPI0020435BB9|nr:class I SAM-dependent methyltransferase [Parasegetibacter sp. NRK P23]MCM5529976.1 class I SAM-dependent methyltransferase [Parasegetibacter sp. NRK P23]
MMQEPDWHEIARQLGNPSGSDGIKTAERMQENNAGMIRKAIDVLRVNNDDRVLEIGFGNGSHLPYILSQAENIVYTGIDISETMVEEAHRLNKHAVEQGQASFSLSNGKDLPFEDEIFDHIFTVNTVYFWSDPGLYLLEMIRVLRKGGRLAIGFAPASFMEKLPFTRFGFRLYTPEAIQNLVTEAGFHMERLEEEEEEVRSNGEVIRRNYMVLVGVK